MALTAELLIGSGYGPPSALAFDDAGEGRHVRAWCLDGREAGESEVMARVAHVLPQVVEALAWRHARGQAYGRLTPDAVLVDRDGRVALARVSPTTGPRSIPDDVAAFGRLAADLLDLLDAPPPECAPRIERMVDVDPAARPSLAMAARGLLGPLGGRAPLHPRPPRPDRALIGRERLLTAVQRRLTDMSDGRFRLVVLTGPVGVGKASLAASAASDFEAGGGLVLRGRARPRDRRAFGAVAEAVDALTMALGRRYGGARSSTEAFLAAGEGARVRADFFVEVVRLLQGAGQAGPGVVIIVEDLQWADEDSLALLDHVARAAPGRVAVLATLADNHGRGAAADWLDDRTGAERIDVPVLGDDDTRKVLERAARHAGGRGLGIAEIEGALQHVGGLPALAELIGRELARGGDHRRRHTLLEGVGHQVRGLADADRTVLALLLAADDWLEQTEVAQLAGLASGEAGAAVEELIAVGLVRRGGGAGPSAVVALAHETVQHSVRQGLTDDERAAGHSALAASLRGDATARPERLVRHLAGAGKADAAARIARVAALSAERLGAYGLAADMYEVALSVPAEGRIALLQARARALERSGRVADAADTWETLADLDDDAVPPEATIRAAEALLAAGELAQGARRLERPPTDPAALLLAARPAGFLDPRRPDGMLGKAADALLLAGDAPGACRAATLRAVYARMAASGRRAERRAGDLRRRADALAPPLPWRLLLDGMQVLAEDRPRDSRPRLIEAAAALADAGHPTSPERRLALVLSLEASRRTGSPRLLMEASALARAALDDAPDLELACEAALAEALALATDHQTNAARACLTTVRRGLPESPLTLAVLRLAAIALVHELGAASPAASRARLQGLLAAAKAQRLHPMEGLRGGLVAAIGARVEAAALRAGDPAASSRRVRKLLAVARGCSAWDGEFGMAPAAQIPWA